MEVHRGMMRGGPKRRWLHSVRDDIRERRDCRGRQCTTEQIRGIYRHIETPNKSVTKKKMEEALTCRPTFSWKAAAAARLTFTSRSKMDTITRALKQNE